MYSLTERGQTTTVSMYKKIPKTKDDIIAELKEDVQYWTNQYNEASLNTRKAINGLWAKEREIENIKKTISNFKSLLTEV